MARKEYINSAGSQFFILLSRASILDGEYTTYKGQREFAFKTARLDLPTNPRDALHYVCARTKGLGAAAESLIWAHAGERWPDIQPGDVPRLSGRVYENFRLQCESLTSKSEEAQAVAALINAIQVGLAVGVIDWPAAVKLAAKGLSELDVDVDEATLIERGPPESPLAFGLGDLAPNGAGLFSEGEDADA